MFCFLFSLFVDCFSLQITGSVYSLADPDETPLKLLTGHAGRKIFVSNPKGGDKQLLIDCEGLRFRFWFFLCLADSGFFFSFVSELKMEQILFEEESARCATNSLVIWKKAVAAILIDDLGTADKEKVKEKRSVCWFH